MINIFKILEKSTIAKINFDVILIPFDKVRLHIPPSTAQESFATPEKDTTYVPPALTLQKYMKESLRENEYQNYKREPARKGYTRKIKTVALEKFPIICTFQLESLKTPKYYKGV